jgi:hypothetical protein
MDPFSPEADPGREQEEQARSARPQGTDGKHDHAARVGRRTLMTALAVLPAAAAACTHPRPACPSVVGEPERCAHRFCRYHRG